MYNIGQKLLVVDMSNRVYPEAPFPKEGDVVISEGHTPSGLGVYIKGYNYILPDGRRMAYLNWRFVPLDAIKELTSSFTEIKETSDNPVSIPQTI